MLNLLYVLTPIALLDSTSITPLSIVPMALLLAGRRPYVTVSAFLLGLYVSYLVMALGFLFGLSQVFEQLNTWFTNKLQNPDALDLLLQIGIGLILIFFGARIATKRKQKTGQREAPAPATPAKAFVFAVGLNVVGFPGAVPYFAAADQILRADLPSLQMLVAVVYYVTVFLTPLILLVVLKAALGRRGDQLLSRVKEFFDRWGSRIVAVLLLGLGLILVADGIGWFYGAPLLPVVD